MTERRIDELTPAEIVIWSAFCERSQASVADQSSKGKAYDLNMEIRSQKHALRGHREARPVVKKVYAIEEKYLENGGPFGEQGS